MHRVFFDSNDGGHGHGYMLSLPKSLEDLAAIGGDLVEGLRVVIYMPRELEMEADLSFSATDGCWVAHPVEETLVHLDT